MIEERLVKSFMDMVQIDSLSTKEKKFAEYVMDILKDMGFTVTVDQVNENFHGEIGNVFARLPGNPEKEPLCFCAHLDTVVPGLGIKPSLKDGLITSDGTTILAGDDKSGVSSILEAVRSTLENNVDHGDIELLFTVAEERALDGSKGLDVTPIQANMLYVLDSDGTVGGIINVGPTQMKMEFSIFGRACHAGVEPEKGISAIQVAAAAISQMTLLRIDHETTSNIGVIAGGEGNHIVCDKVTFTAEVRSLKEAKMQAQVQHMKDCVAKAAADFGTTYEIKEMINYPSFHVTEEQKIMQIAMGAMKKIGVPIQVKGTGAGSDCNIINGKGIDAIILATGITNPHSKEECITVEDLCNSARLVEEMIKLA